MQLPLTQKNSNPVRGNWQLFSGAISAELCDHMVNEFKKLPEMTAKTFNDQHQYRKSKVRWVYDQDNLVDLLMKYVHKANATEFNVDIQPEMGEMQFGEYEASYGGKYDWHHDVNWENHKNFDRKLSLVVQLSRPSEYKGGHFEFSEVQSPDRNAWSKQGSILVFPSYLTHRVTEVTEGTRYSLVSWVRGPRWR